MTPLPSSQRRITALLLGVLIGLAVLATPALATPALATPAQAGPPKPVKDVAVTGHLLGCNEETGQWTVQWIVSNGYLNAATVRDLRTAPVPVDGLTDGSVILTGQLILIQKVPGTAREASVAFTATMPNLTDRDNVDIVPIDGVCKEREKPCVTPAKATFHHEFAVEGSSSSATVTLDDGVKLCEPEPVTLASYFAPRPRFAVPQYVFDHATGTITNENRQVTLTAAVPACDTQVDLFFGGPDDLIEEITEDGPRYGDRKLGSDTGLGARSAGGPAWFNGGTQGCRQPAVAHDDKCDGTVAVHLSNSGDISRYPVDFTVAAGSFTRTVTVRPGTAETVDVPAGAGEIQVSADGMPTKKITWTRPADCPAPAVVVKNDCDTVTVTVTNPEGVVPATAAVTYGGDTRTVTVAPGATDGVTFPAGTAPELTVAFPGLGLDPVRAVLEKPDCTTPTPTPGTPEPGAGGGLPITGAAAGGIAAGAAALLIAGAVLLFLTRRRRTRFTA